MRLPEGTKVIVTEDQSDGYAGKGWTGTVDHQHGRYKELYYILYDERHRHRRAEHVLIPSAYVDVRLLKILCVITFDNKELRKELVPVCYNFDSLWKELVG